MFLLPFSIFFVIREQNPPFLLPNELGVPAKRHQALAEAEQGGQSNSKAGARERSSNAPVEHCSERGFGAEPQ